MSAAKIIGAAAIVAASSGIGFQKSHTMRKRCDTLAEFIRAFGIFKGEVSFMKSNLGDIFSKAARTGILPEFFTGVAERLTECGTEGAWAAALRTHARELALERGDIELLTLIGSELGKVGAAETAASLDNAHTMVEEQYRRAVREYERDASMWRSMGIILGAAAAIVLF